MFALLNFSFTIVCFLIVSHVSNGQYSFSQQPNNSLAIWAYRPWYEDAYLYGGYFYGYSFASGEDRPTNWTAGDEEFDVYIAMDLDAEIIYMLDKNNYGFYDIITIDPNCKDAGEWCETSILYSCNATTSDFKTCQQEATSSWNQAVAFDPDTRLFWWVGRPGNSSNYGFYSLNVDTLTGPTFNDWGVYNTLRQLANIRTYKGYLYVCEKLDDGLVRYNLTDGTREVVIGLNDYTLDGATSENLGAFTFDESSDLLYFSVHDNFGVVPAKIYSRQWNQTSTSPYTEYDIGSALPYQIRGMAVNPGLELFYITDDQDTTQTITKLILNLEYPPIPRAELLLTSSQYIAKSIEVIPGTQLDYTLYYPNDLENYYTIDDPQDWDDGEARLIWMELNSGDGYNAAIRVAKDLSFGTSFVSDTTNLWERTGVSTQRFSSIYLDLKNERIWIIDPQEQYQRIQYLSFEDNLVHDFFTCPYPVWYELDTCNTVFPVCNADTCSMYIDAGANMMYFMSQGNYYYWNMSHYLNVNPRTFPSEFSFGDEYYIYYAGSMMTDDDYLYVATSNYGIFRKDLTTIGIDNSSDLIVNSTSGFSDADIKCFTYDDIYDVLYICVDDTIYYYDDFSTFDFSTMTIDSTTCTNMGLDSDVSGTIYSVDVSNDGLTLYMQYKSGTAIRIINWPTQYNTDCDTSGDCDPYGVLLYSLGSSFNAQGFTFYFPSNQTVKVLNSSYYDKTTTTRMAGGMSTTETSSAINCVEDAYTYCVTVNVTDGDSDGINSTTVNLLDDETCCDTTFWVVFEMNSDMYDCKDPRISFEYEGMWYSGTSQKIDVYTQDDNYTTATSCYNPSVLSCTNTPNNLCIDDESVNGGNTLNPGDEYIVKVVRASGIGACTGPPSRTINADLTLFCNPSEVTTTTPPTTTSLTTTSLTTTGAATTRVTSETTKSRLSTTTGGSSTVMETTEAMETTSATEAIEATETTEEQATETTVGGGVDTTADTASTSMMTTAASPEDTEPEETEPPIGNNARRIAGVNMMVYGIFCVVNAAFYSW